jgi:hypothetical protein
MRNEHVKVIDLLLGDDHRQATTQDREMSLVVVDA